MKTAEQIAEEIAPAFGRNIQDKVKGKIAGLNTLSTVPVTIGGREELYDAVFNAYRVSQGELAIGGEVELYVNDQGVYEVLGSYGAGVREAYPGDAPPASNAFNQHNHTNIDNGGALGEEAIFDPLQLADGVVTDAKIDSMAVNKLTAPGVLPTDLGGTGNDLEALGVTGRLYFPGGAAPTSVSVFKDVYNSSVDPTAAEDDADGYTAGSVWLNTTTGRAFFCADPGNSNDAVWRPMALNWSVPLPIGNTTPNTGAFTTLSANHDANNRLETMDGGEIITQAETSALSSPATVEFRRANGTIASPTAASSGQIIGRTDFKARNSSNAYQSGGFVEAETTEAPTSSARGTKLRLRTTQTGGTTTRDFVLQDYGAVNPPALTADPSSPVAGDKWRRSDTKLNRTRLMGINESNVLAPYTQVGDRSITGTVSGTNLPNYTFTIPAGEAVAGMIFVLEAWGYLTTSGTANRTWTVETGGAVALWSTAYSLGSVTIMWSMRVWLGINAIGSSGNIWAQGFITSPTTTRGTANTAVSGAINFNNAVDINVIFTPASVSDAMHCNGFTIYRL